MTTTYLNKTDERAKTGAWTLGGLGILGAFLVVNALAPQLQSSGLEQAVIRTLTHLLVLLGTWEALGNTSLPRRARFSTWLSVAVVWTTWLAVVWWLAYGGRFIPGATRIPLLPLDLVFSIGVFGVVAGRSARVGEILDAAPAWWLVALQAYRIFGAIFLFEWMDGNVPALFAFPAGTGDVLTGLAALPVAALLAASTGSSKRIAMAWNAFGLLDMCTAIFLGATTSPGPLQLFSFSEPNLGIGHYPAVMIPAVTVPMSIVLHILSLRQLRRMQSRAPEVAR